MGARGTSGRSCRILSRYFKRSKKGKETREDIAGVTASGKAEIEKQLKNLHTELNKALKNLDEMRDQKTAAAKKEVKAATDKATKVQSRVRELLSAVHEGSAEDPELKKALKDGKSALEAVRKFITK